MPEIDFNNPNMLLSFYLMASYAYYSLGRPMMSDMEFEEITKVLHERYEEVTHPHKDLVPKSALACPRLRDRGCRIPDRSYRPSP